MNPCILACEAGGSEQFNADHADHWQTQGGHFYVVCDGINHNENTVAAVIEFCELLRNEFLERFIGDEITLTNAIMNAVRSLESRSANFAFCMTAALKLQDRLIVAHCGDCRLGVLTPEGVDWQTKDDVPCLELYQQGKMNRDDYLKTRHLVSCKIKPTFRSESLKIFSMADSAPRCLLLCSDGFWSYVEINLNEVPILNEEVITNMLPELTNKASDNFSVILV